MRTLTVTCTGRTDTDLVAALEGVISGVYRGDEYGTNGGATGSFTFRVTREPDPQANPDIIAFVVKWAVREDDLNSDVMEALMEASQLIGIGDSNQPGDWKTVSRYLETVYSNILEGYENPGMREDHDDELAADIVALFNAVDGTAYTINPRPTPVEPQEDK